jgi:hypothetical protein
LGHYEVLIRDRDDKFGAVFDRVAAGAGARVVRTAVQAPLMNAVCERFLGSVRRECLDHIIILSRAHLRHVLVEYSLSYFNTARPHQGIGQQIPLPAERAPGTLGGSVIAIPVLDFTTTTTPRHDDGGWRKEPGQRLNTASCCRSTRISTMRFARGRKVAMSAPNTAETIASTTDNDDADRVVRHERIAAADRVESAAPRCVSSHHSRPARHLHVC